MYDYIYRPAEIEEMSLYDWIRRCKRKKFNELKEKKKGGKQIKEKEDKEDSESGDEEAEEEEEEEEGEEEGNIEETEKPTNQSSHPHFKKGHLYKFTEGHPLQETHGTTVAADNEQIVANFIGKPLPRRDEGNRELYCQTMLVLFKPWRRGCTLKNKKDTWDETFLQHTFTDRQTQLMQNFNIKYECLDARDDYHAQLRKTGTQALFEYGLDTQEEKEEYSLQEDSELIAANKDESEETEIHIYEGKIMMTGRGEQKRQREAAEIRTIIQQTGWTQHPKNQQNGPRHEPIELEEKLYGTEWKSRIQTLKESIIEKKQENKQVKVKQNIPANTKPNQVKIIDKAYLEKKFYKTGYEKGIKEIQAKFKLNKEQERAFNIVSHHSVMPESEQLKMYIGGMGGTGKSQIIKAISAFFHTQNEAHRFLIVAPTGSAAALLGGSTYHSVLGINEKTGNTPLKVLAQVKTKLAGVDYIFMDEVSMISAHDLYKISRQLCKVMNKPETPFGGISMIFAGDFAQLPPPIGGENASLYSRTIGQTATSQHKQEEAIGKGLWHQITTVVILRQNMRQTINTPADKKFRQALENMRYKDCTVEDIQFLRTRITSQQAGRPSICDTNFRNNAIITAKNVQKDEINKLGGIRFALETNQKLTQFFSEDNINANLEQNNSYEKRRTTLCKIHAMTPQFQQMLWKLPHSSGDKQMAGTLSLCLGMPIIIKYNVATELGITNGQEGTVVGWQSCKGNRGQKMLETVFIKLTNPPFDIKIPGLPQNIVPMTCSTNTITCSLPDDSKIQISRKQVEILPNFAMTDYASQGKTRKWNPVDLNNCRSHQAYYTALSRSATAEGTVILQGFDTRKITEKASGALRQEFRELELLDEISKLQYESKIPNTVTGKMRNTLIHTYRTYIQGHGICAKKCTSFHQME